MYLDCGKSAKVRLRALFAIFFVSAGICPVGKHVSICSLCTLRNMRRHHGYSLPQLAIDSRMRRGKTDDACHCFACRSIDCFSDC
jgi:hypothetical protein